MGEGREELSAEQIQFVCQECNITEEELFSFDDDELNDRVYEVMCDIEIAFCKALERRPLLHLGNS